MWGMTYSVLLKPGLENQDLVMAANIPGHCCLHLAVVGWGNRLHFL